jgi:hypothetical protein
MVAAHGAVTSTSSQPWLTTNQIRPPSGRVAPLTRTEGGRGVHTSAIGARPRSASAHRSSAAVLARSGSVPTQVTRPFPTG